MAICNTMNGWAINDSYWILGRFDEKELPEIALWERYMVSATILGIADKVQKSMKIQIERIEALATTTDNTSIYGIYIPFI